MCEELDDRRYKQIKARDGLPIREAISGICHTLVWCAAALTHRSLPDNWRAPIARTEIARAVKHASKRLETIEQKLKKRQLKEVFPLPTPELQRAIAARGDFILDFAIIVHQVYQLHLRRAFYVIDRESGILFPGGDRSYLKLYADHPLRFAFPIESKLKP